ncbi:hypothetical protein AB0O28_10965 [Microbispora sp. NPDC088329]|uniref:hypothetical protein n=1 Tax=Microbispora sp. NPDC088329 TaxID=3154869 RepID=UPI0034437691
MTVDQGITENRGPHMRDRADFERYVEQRSDRLLRTAYLFCRDWATADENFTVCHRRFAERSRDNAQSARARNHGVDANGCAGRLTAALCLVFAPPDTTAIHFNGEGLDQQTNCER